MVEDENDIGKETIKVYLSQELCLLVWYAGGYTGIYTIRVKETIIHASLVHWLQYKVTINL